MTDMLKATAEALVAHCRAHTEDEGLRTLYAPDAVSVEAFRNPQTGTARTEGIAGIEGKHAWWEANFDVHESTIEGPMYHGDNRFAVIFEIEATEKTSANRIHMTEVAIYTTNDAGKIIREEFYYTT